MVAGFFTREIVLQVSADRIWKAGILDSHILLPKLLPNFVASGELVEGDGGVGTVKKLTFNEGVKEFRFEKGRVEVLDRENYLVKQAVIEGGLIGLRVKTYSYEMKLVGGSDAETIGKIRVEYDTLDETPPLSAEEEEQISGGLFAMIKAIEGYLLDNPSSYA
ncbi:hypothetical protein KSP39_PZI006831 [Platanthera zijinensis]|uniref:Bet v I/Major latex protein domain-containing protein n=1 Tax=Platanthera zijinensis TaxID=2320716 RepID=A0AAP0G9B4_9ASPA